MAYPMAPAITLDELKQRLAPEGITWVDQPDAAGQLDQGYFERVIRGKKVGCPVSVPKGSVLNPRLIYLVYQRLDLDEP